MEWRPLVRLGSLIAGLGGGGERPMAARCKESSLPHTLPQPGRAAPTPGFLLPVTGELRFRQRGAVDGAGATRASRQRRLAFLLLAIWEEEAELHGQAAYWGVKRQLVLASREAAEESQEPPGGGGSCCSEASVGDDGGGGTAGKVAEMKQRNLRRELRSTCQKHLQQRCPAEQQHHLQAERQ